MQTHEVNVTIQTASFFNYILAFISPIGWVMYLAEKDSKPNIAKAYLTASLLLPLFFAIALLLTAINSLDCNGCSFFGMVPVVQIIVFLVLSVGLLASIYFINKK